MLTKDNGLIQSLIQYSTSFRWEWIDEASRQKRWALAVTSGVASGFCLVSSLSDSPLKPYTSALGMGLSGVAIATVAAIKEDSFLYLSQKHSRRQLLAHQGTSRLNQYASALETQNGGNDADLSGWVADGDNSELQIYDFDDLADENTGIMIAGNAGSGKTSVCCWVLGKLTEHEPAIIEVLDPHGGINKIWGELGLSVLSEYWEIEGRLGAAIAELDARRARSKKGEPVGVPYIFVCDELDSCFENFEDPELISKAIKRLGKEGRKYGISLVFISHSSNVGSKGIDAQERNCYVNIYLGGTAHAVAKYSYKKHDPENLFLSQQAYPCLISSGGLPPIPAIHPTHGQYPKFKKVGNPPQNLLPIRQIEVVSAPHTPAHCAETKPLQDEVCTDAHAHDEPDKICPRCHSASVRPNGGTTAGTPRYRCNDCGKSWSVK
jgi:hypothetical protein